MSKKFGTDRKSEIIQAEDVESLDEGGSIEDIPDTPVVLFRTREGYIKKINVAALRMSGEHKLKDDDAMIQEVETTNRAEVIFFAGGNAYKMRVNDIPESKASLLGEYIPNLVGMEEKDKVVGMFIPGDYSGNFVFCFENGKCAKVPVKAYETKSNRRKLTSAYSEKSEVVSVFHMLKDDEILLFSSADKVLCVNTDKIPLKTTRSTQGVSVMTLRRGAIIKNAVRADDANFADVVRYRPRNIPAAGAPIREEDTGIEQISFM